MIDQVKAWNEVAQDLGIQIDAPCEIQLPDGTRIKATAHIKQFGAENGMIVDPVFAVLRPYTKALLANGYGFSAMSLGVNREDLVDVFVDWSWSAPEPPPVWYSEVDDQASI
jgi:hypothetical protein